MTERPTELMTSNVDTVQIPAAAKSRQLCPTLCNPMDCSLPGSSIHGIFQAGVLEWDAIAFSGTNSQPLSNSCYSQATAVQMENLRLKKKKAKEAK